MNGELRIYLYSAGHSQTSSNEVRFKDLSFTFSVFSLIIF